MSLDELNDMGHSTDVNRLDHIPTTLRNLPSKIPFTTVTFRKQQLLSPEYTPGEFDVCCGRGKRHWNHIGNVRFRRIIQSNVDRYIAAPTKNDKTTVVVSIVSDIRQLGGCFLKEDLKGMWYDIGDQQAREKVGHSLRDQVSTIHRQQQKQEAVQQFKSTKPNEITPATSPVPSHFGQPPVLVGSAGETPLENHPLQTKDEDYNNGEDDDDAQSDGHNERHSRRGNLTTSQILDKFARRPSFVSFRAGAVSGSSGSKKTSFNSSRSSSKRSSGWSFLNDLDLDLFDGDFTDGPEPIAYNPG